MPYDKIVDSSQLDAQFARIAGAIRAKTGKTEALTPAQMPGEIAAIETGSLDDGLATYSQVNPQAAAYLAAAEAAYTDSNSASVTVMPNYASADAQQDGCAGYELTLDAGGTLYLLDETQPKGGWKLTVSSGSNTVCNLIPGHTYRWLLVNAAGATVQGGRLKATGELRMIRLSYMRNVRDLGGWPCAAGKVNYGRLYRGMTLSQSDADLRILRDQLGIGVEIDLRGDSESDNQTLSRLGETVAYYRYPLETGYKEPVDLGREDRQYLSTREALKRVMEAAYWNVPAYFHCSIGCDRTGMLGYLVGALLGMSRADLDKNYELSALTGTVDSANVTSRLRTRQDWNNMADYLATLGGTTPQENVVNWCARVGIPAKLINRFRLAMCSGTPAAISYSNTVTTALTNATLSNSAASVTNGGSYSATVTANAAAALERVSVTMAGEDITAWAYDSATGAISIGEVLGDLVISAQATYNTVPVTLALTDVTAANTAASTILGLSYSNTLSTSPDKRIASAAVTMGGADITADAFNSDTGAVSIGEVTGNIVITAAAEVIPVNYTNMIPLAQTATGTEIFNGTGYQDGKYLSSSGNGEGSDANFFATGFIPCAMTTQSGKCTIYVKGADWTEESHCRFNLYPADKSLKKCIGTGSALLGPAGTLFLLTVLDANTKYWKLETVMKTNTAPACVNTYGALSYFRLSLRGSGQGVIVTVNEPIE